VLWGVSWEQLTLAGAIFIVFVPPARLWMYLLLATLYSLISMPLEAKLAFRREYFLYGVLTFATGFTWLTYLQLYIPTSSLAYAILFRIVSIPFCIFLVLSCDAFMRCITLVVVHRVRVSSSSAFSQMHRSMRTSANTVSASLSDMSSDIAKLRLQESKARATAATEIMIMFRLLVDLVIVIVAFSLQNFNLVVVINQTSMYTLGFTVALLPLGRSTYSGLVLFGVSRDAFKFGALVSNHEDDDRVKGSLENASLTRLLLRNQSDETVAVPQIELADTCASFQDSETRPCFTSLVIANPRSAACESVLASVESSLLGTQYPCGLQCTQHDGVSLVAWTTCSPGLDSELTLACVDGLHTVLLAARSPLRDHHVLPIGITQPEEYPEYTCFAPAPASSRSVFGLVLSGDEFAGEDERFITSSF
jgi:hypothetical protein